MMSPRDGATVTHPPIQVEGTAPPNAEIVQDISLARDNRIVASGLLSAIDRGQRHHDAARRALESTPPPWLLSPFVLAELDYLLATRVGQDAGRALLAEIGRGVYRLEAFEPDDIASAERLIGRYRELDIGLADASLVVLAHRYGVRDLLSLDERHFRTLRGAGGCPFRLLPADGQG